MADIVIEVAIPEATDIAPVTDIVDVVADPEGATVIIAAVPGAPVPLTAGQLAQLADDAAAAVLDDLTPPVPLVLWFENQLQ